MSSTTPTLHMVCGKIGAGKSNLAARLRHETGAVLISEDAWLSGLFSDQMTTPSDFVRFSAKLRDVLGPHVSSLLSAGMSVVLDFQANTVESRAWMRDLLEATGAAHQLHVLVTPDEVCLRRLRARNAGGDHPFTVTEEQFHRISKHYVAPTPDEGFSLVMHETTE